MDTVTCRQCSAVVQDGYFCANCGKPLKAKPPSTSLSDQMKVYLVSIFLPPFGLWYVYTYAKVPNNKMRIIAAIALILTIASSYASYLLLKSVADGVDQQLQMLNSSGLY